MIFVIIVEERRSGMPDREVVIKSLINCMSDGHYCVNECQYFKFDDDCLEFLMHDAAQLLKAQEPIAPIIEQDMNEYTSDIEEIYFCGICRYKVYKSEKYCANCGRKIKWNV